MRWYVEFQMAGATAQNHELTGLDQVRCGTESSAQFRLPKHSGLPESLLHIEAKPDGVVLGRTNGSLPDIEYDGKCHRQVCVPWEHDCFIGPLRLCFLRSEGNDGRKSSMGSTLFLVLLVAFAGFGVWGMSRGQTSAPDFGKGPEPPELWSKDAARCSVAQGAAYLERVTELHKVAESKAARYLFDRRLGTEAARLLQQVRDCYVTAKEPNARVKADIDEIDRQTERLKTRMEQDYSSLRLSLEFAREKHDEEAVQRLTATLLTLLGLPREHPYARWLSAVGRDAKDRLRAKTVEG